MMNIKMKKDEGKYADDETTVIFDENLMKLQCRGFQSKVILRRRKFEKQKNPERSPPFIGFLGAGVIVSKIRKIPRFTEVTSA